MRDAKVKIILIVLVFLIMLVLIVMFKGHKTLHKCHGDDLPCYYKTAQKYIDRHDYESAARVYEAGCAQELPQRQICRLQKRLESLLDHESDCYSGYGKGSCREAALSFLYWQRDVGYEIVNKHQAEIESLLLKGCKGGDDEACVMRKAGILLYKNRFGTYQHSR